MTGHMPTQVTAISSTLPSLLVPIANKQLLLPTVSIAEMLPFQKPQMRNTDIQSSPVWFLGMVRWRGIMVPMVSYEAINGGDIPAVKGVSQMAILNNTGVNPAIPFLCFPTQGIPRLSRVTESVIKEDQEQEKMAYDEMNVMINGEPATIPNIEKLEHALIGVLNP
jgi:chemosensory pili system protein ChpC